MQEIILFENSGLEDQEVKEIELDLDLAQYIKISPSSAGGAI